MRVGDRWVRLDRSDPIGGPLLVAADIAALFGAHEYGDVAERDITSLATGAVMSFSTLMTNKTYLQSLAKVLDAIRGGRFGEKKLDAVGEITLDIIAGGLVPNLVAEMRRSIDPSRREVEGALAHIKNRVPGWSKTLPAKTNDWGDPILYGYGIGPGILNEAWNFFSPLATSQIQQHPAAKILADNQIPFNGPSKLLNGIELSDEQHNIYKKLAGDVMKQHLVELEKLPAWQRLSPGPEGGRAFAVGRVREAAVKQAQAQMLRDPKFADVLDKMRQAPLKKLQQPPALQVR